ncbi:hypothetical protein T08_3646 [Trichinella sp. T8]|nr:hypothetical protein T08_3646 [Trichinella sp. T8]
MPNSVVAYRFKDALIKGIGNEEKLNKGISKAISNSPCTESKVKASKTMLGHAQFSTVSCRYLQLTPRITYSIGEGKAA